MTIRILEEIDDTLLVDQNLALLNAKKIQLYLDSLPNDVDSISKLDIADLPKLTEELSNSTNYTFETVEGTPIYSVTVGVTVGNMTATATKQIKAISLTLTQKINMIRVLTGADRHNSKVVLRMSKYNLQKALAYLSDYGYVNIDNPTPVDGSITGISHLITDVESVKPDNYNKKANTYNCGDCGEKRTVGLYCPECGTKVDWSDYLDE